MNNEQRTMNNARTWFLSFMINLLCGFYVAAPTKYIQPQEAVLQKWCLSPFLILPSSFAKINRQIVPKFVNLLPFSPFHAIFNL
jgi:hypothetical protein